MGLLEYGIYGSTEFMTEEWIDLDGPIDSVLFFFYFISRKGSKITNLEHTFRTVFWTLFGLGEQSIL